MEPDDLWRQIADTSAFAVPDSLSEKLARYRDWLITEAIPAGGIGPGEVPRLDTRHIADSLLFAMVMEPTDLVLDVGTGVGLPGIPLACLMPGTQFVLLDRSARRVGLVRRAARILQLDNVEAVQSDVCDWKQSVPALVARASIPPEDLLSSLKTLLSPGGIAVVGGSWNERPETSGYAVEEIGSAFLDRSVWILMMRQT
ncbi:MAG: 16S rRNA (guanine(527)-N(7))-methyltransferase RsmG [Acidimicrobiia bacterium]